MFETRLTRAQRIARAIRQFFSLNACMGMTVAQQLRLAAVAGAIGAAVAILGVRWYLQENPAPVVILDPVVERAATDYSVVRIGFEQAGAETWCHLVLRPQSAGWMLRC